MKRPNSVPHRLEQYFTVEQIARCLQVPQDYVRSLINNGILECIKLPGNLENPVRISVNSFESFIRSCQPKKQASTFRQISEQRDQNQSSDSSDKKICHSVFEV